VKVVLVHGVFDLLHAGHLEHLKQARKFGDWLIVSVVPDKHLSKGPAIYREMERVRLLKALRCVNQVELCDGPGPENIIQRVLPNIYVRGDDYIGKRMPESALLEKLGIAVGYTKSVPPRTSEVIERIKCL
jgi:D-beta-D-heptose 7-phosphate kinase/D-beta-D-heptose 1-phosphate adenosyltransferase